MSVVVQRSRLTVNGVQTRLVQAGDSEDREAAVFVHGNPGSADDWVELVGALGSGGLRAVAFDLPDFGETAAPRGFEHSVPGYAVFLGEVMRCLGIDRAHLIIHDFGGPIGMAWALDHPDSLASVTLIDIGVMPGYRWHGVARIWRTPLLGEIFQAGATRGSFRVLIERGEPQGLPRPFIERMYDQYDRRTRRAVLKLYRATDNIGAAGAEFAARMAPRDIPALVIWGEHDVYLPSRYAERQREAFPSAEVHVLPDSGHWPFADAPETVERLLVEFLARNRKTSA
ncbi:MAG: alpha/beta hydrolase [Solirubrobacterales bacterium]